MFLDGLGDFLGQGLLQGDVGALAAERVGAEVGEAGDMAKAAIGMHGGLDMVHLGVGGSLWHLKPPPVLNLRWMADVEDGISPV
jgi:hypothetical protein